MPSDPDAIVVDVARHSRLMLAGRTIVNAVERGWAASRGRALFLAAHRRVSDVNMSERVRLLGVLLLVATVVHAVLVHWSPAIARPWFPWMIELPTIATALVLLSAPDAIARAWRSSRLARFFARGRSSRYTDADSLH